MKLAKREQVGIPVERFYKIACVVELLFWDNNKVNGKSHINKFVSNLSSSCPNGMAWITITVKMLSMAQNEEKDLSEW